MRLQPGSTVSARELPPVIGPTIPVPDRERLVHLQFRRFAGCPICNLHLRSIVTRHAEIEAAGIREVVVFHSPSEELAEHAAGLPFAVIADPGKKLYAEFGVESAPRALLAPRIWGTIVRAVARSLWMIARGREHGPARRVHGGRLGLPADFLIAPDGRVLACKYGEHAYDQWPVDELLALVARKRQADTAR
jgi:peroxiredoxin